MASWLRANEVPLPPGLVSGATASGGVAPGNGGLSIPPGGGSPANPAVAGPVTLFNQLIKKWEDTKASTSQASFDPTEILCQIADILEKVRTNRLVVRRYVLISNVQCSYLRTIEEICNNLF